MSTFLVKIRVSSKYLEKFKITLIWSEYGIVPLYLFDKNTLKFYIVAFMNITMW